MSVLINKRFAAMTVLAGIARLQNTMIGIALIAAGTTVGYSVIQSAALGGALFLCAALSAVFKGQVVDQRGRGIVIAQALGSAAFLAVNTRIRSLVGRQRLTEGFSVVLLAKYIGA